MDWAPAIKAGKQSGSPFSYGGAMTEIALLGLVAIKMLGTKLEWDSEKMQFTNCAEANQYIAPPFRQGWTL